MDASYEPGVGAQDSGVSHDAGSPVRPMKTKWCPHHRCYVRIGG